MTNVESHLGHNIITFRNNKRAFDGSSGYWVARCVSGNFKNLTSWQLKKKDALSSLKSTLDKVMKNNLNAKEDDKG